MIKKTIYALYLIFGVFIKYHYTATYEINKVIKVDRSTIRIFYIDTSYSLQFIDTLSIYEHMIRGVQ